MPKLKHLLATSILATLPLLLASQAIAESVVWNVSLWGKRRAFTEHVEKLKELVEQKTNGDFRLNISYGGLSKNKENLDGISIGAFEMAQFCAGYHRDKNPSITVLELPYLGVKSLEQERKISQKIYKHPAVIKDLARWNATLLMPSPLPQYNILGVGKAPTSFDGYKGLSVRATGGIGKAMKALGAVPTSMSATEVRQALDSGVIKAVAFAPHAHMAFGTVETGKWWTTNLNPGTLNCPVVVNTDALEKLSQKNRKALLASVKPALDHYINHYNNKTLKAWGPKLDEKGIQRITYDKKDLKDLKDKVAQPAAKEWVKKNTAKGIPAQELYDTLVKAIK